jgi:hypothetical protein
VAASDKQGVGEFFFGTDGEGGFMGTLCTDENEWFDKARTQQSIEVPLDQLTNILAANDCPADFGLLLVDTEGMDYECFVGLDFGRFRPRVIVTEEYAWDEEKHRRKYELLERNDYRLRKRVGCNTIWRTIR